MTKSKENRLIFTGHFDVGEKCTDKVLSIVNEAKFLDGQIVVLVGDIAITQKVITYIQHGLDGLIMLYHIREFMCESACILEQLPENESEILSRIDVDVYEFISSHLQQYHNKLYNHILKRNYCKKSLDSILNREVVPELIQSRVLQYGLAYNNTLIFTEKYLRNIVMRRVSAKRKAIKKWNEMKSFNKDSYGCYIDNELIVNGNGSPLCRGIVFAFYESIWNLKFEIIDHYIEKRHKSSISKGLNLFLNNYHHLNYLNTGIKETYIKSF